MHAQEFGIVTNIYQRPGEHFARTVERAERNGRGVVLVHPLPARLSGRGVHGRRGR